MKRVLVTVLVAVCALGTAACQSNPQVAAYVNGEAISEDEVDAIIDNARVTGAAADAEMEKAAGQPLDASQKTMIPTRTEVVSALILDRVCAAQQVREGFESTPISADQVAQSFRLAPDAQLTAIEARKFGCLNGAISVAPVTAAPTEAEIRVIYDRAAAANLLQEGATFELVGPQLASDAGVRQVLARKSAIDALVGNGGLVVNPRYRPIELTISDLQTGVPLVVSTVGQPGNNAVS
jgi:hypothetical protein